MSREIEGNELALVAADDDTIRLVFPEAGEEGLSASQEFLVAAITRAQLEPAFGGYIVEAHRDLMGMSTDPFAGLDESEIN
jgi:hypothetical protein